LHCSLFKFALFLNSVLVFWKLLIFEFLLGISETSLCSTSVPKVKIVPLLDVLQLPMLFARMFTYLETKLFSLIIFYNGSCFILNYLLYAI
jgi:hypothetical protein